MKYARKKFSQSSGFTLMELVASLAIAGIIFAAAAVALGTFFSKYNELSKYADLQSQAFDCLSQSIKYGRLIGNSANDKQWFGIANAESVELLGSESGEGAQGIKILPAKTGSDHMNDWVKFQLSGGKIVSSYRYGNSSSSAQTQVFPPKLRYNKPSDITVTDLRFKPVRVPGTSGKFSVVRVTLDAKIKVRSNYYKYVHYTTKMATVVK